MRSRKRISTIIKEYKTRIKHRFLPSENIQHGTIDTWRIDFFVEILVYLVPLSILIFIPSFIMSIKDGLFVLAFFNSIAFLIIQYIFFSKKISLQSRQIALLVTLYTLGISLLYFLGWSGPGLVYLLGFSAFSSLIISKNTGYITLMMNIAVFIILAIISRYNLVENNMLSGMTPAAIITIGLNFILLNLLLVVTISSLIKGLESKIQSEHEVKERLEVEVEEHKKAKVRAQESDRLKSAFLANMSHEIRTPMNGILGFAQLLKLPKITEEKQKEFLDIIEVSGERMLNIINNIIDISKIESGQIEISKGKLNINEQINYIYSFFKPEVDKEQITLKCTKPIEDSKAFNYTDSEKVYAVLINLIKNAIKYSQGDSIEFGYNKIDGFIEYFVKDNGIGIPKEKQKIIFDRFTQVESVSKSTNEGAGLGLAIAKAYVEILGGKIWIKSDENRGTTFFFTIPLLNESLIN